MIKSILIYFKQKFHSHDWVCIKDVSYADAGEILGISESEALRAAWDINEPGARISVCLSCGKVDDRIEPYLKKINDATFVRRERLRHAKAIYQEHLITLPTSQS